MSFGQLLRQFRTAAGLSQEQLADLAHISVESVGALERGTRRAPYRETVAVLVEALKLNATDRAAIEAIAEAARSRAPRRGSSEKQPEQHTHLPIPPTGFVGRNQDVADITEMLEANRLVTVTGSGGVGKTRVAIEVASRMPPDRWPDVRFVDFSKVGGGALVAETVAAALDLTSDATANVAGLVRSIGSSRLFLVLDNCEHLVADVALLISAILQSCPNVALLATSRERLAISGEMVYRLPSLDVPAEMPVTIEAARRYASIELFVQRAEAIDRAVGFRDLDIDAIVGICRRLDGIPLAIELAAARVVSLGLATLSNRLREGLALVGTLRNLPARQQTMQATIGWSYDLQSPDERRVLQGLSLFAGGFTLAAAEAVCGADLVATDAVADILSSLVDKSLVSIARSGRLQRFALLDSVRSFALERLTEAGQFAFYSERHAEWKAAFADWVDAARAEFPDRRLRTEVDPELENARAALTWALEPKTEAGAVIAGRIVGGLRTIWLTSGRRAECRRWATAVLEIIDERRHPRIVAPLLRALVQTADEVELFALADRATLVFGQIGDHLGTALLHSHVSTVHRRRGFIDEAEAAIEKAGAIFAVGDLPRLMPYAAFLQNRMVLRIDQGRYAEARADLDEATAIMKSLGDEDALTLGGFRADLAFVNGSADAAVIILQDTVDRDATLGGLSKNYLQEIHVYLAIYNVLAGRNDAAYRAGREALRRTKTAADAPIQAIHALALLAAVRGQAPRAARLLGWFEAFARSASGADYFYLPSGPAYVACRERLVEILDTALAPEEIERLKAEGRTLSIDAALAEAQQV